MNILDEFNFEWFIDEIEDGGVLKFREDGINVCVSCEDDKVVVSRYKVKEVTEENMFDGEPLITPISSEEMDFEDVRLKELYESVKNKKYVLKRANRYNC